MSEKEYEMNDDYKKAAAILVEKIAERDEIAADIKLLPPAKRPEALRLLADYDKFIERGEQVLADEYESYQNLRRAEEKRDAAFDDIAERTVEIFIHIKYRHPEQLEEVRAIILNNHTPEEEQDFYDRVAIKEAEDLISLIARQGETREETEKFLKNYRAAQIFRKQ